MVAIAFVASAWGPRFGGINAFNADLCRAVATARPDVNVYCVTGGARDSEINQALTAGVQLVNVDRNNLDRSQSQLIARALADWARTVQDLQWWIGHDVITGPAAVEVARLTGARVAVIQHTDYASYGALKGTPGTEIAERDQAEARTLAEADVLFGVGPKLAAAALDRLRLTTSNIQVTEIVPGLPDITPARTPPSTFRAVTYGRLDEQSDRIKQARLAVRSFGELIRGAPEIVGHDPRISVIGLTDNQLAEEQAELDSIADRQAGRLVSVVGQPFTEDRELLFRVLADASVALMLSVHEGFGLAGWEAIAAEVPLVLSRNSGLYMVLEQLGGAALGCVHVVDVRGDRRPPYHTPGDVRAVTAALRDIAVNAERAKKDARTLKGFLAGYDWTSAATGFVNALYLPTLLSPAQTAEKLEEHHSSVLLPSTLPPRFDDELLGRADQLARLESIAKDGRTPLISVLGPPGSGKTRFVTELAHRLRDTFADRVYFVDLSAVADPDLVAASITRALQIEARDPVLNALRDFFRWNRALLVLDNFEQVTPAALALRELIGGAPLLQLIVTSRHRLGVVGERPFALEELLPDDAVALFRERRGGNAVVDTDDTDVIRQICARVDNLPLAIELVAAHAQVYSSLELLQVIEDSPLDFKNPRVGADSKQQSLRDAIDWSYNLLDPPEARVLRQLSVFAGGWTVTSASGVLAKSERADRQIAAHIEKLYDRSLVRRTGDRLSMFDTIRAYAAEKLEAEADGSEKLAESHAQYFLNRLAGVITDPVSRTDWPGLPDLLADLENCTRALRWFIHAGRRPEAALLGALLGRVWWSTDLIGGLTELSRLAGDIAVENASGEDAIAALWLGRIALRLGRLDSAAESFRRVMTVADRLGDGVLLATGQGDAALVEMEIGNYDAARELLEPAAQWFTTNPNAEGHADVLDSLGEIDMFGQEYGLAADRFSEAIRRYEDIDDTAGIGWVYVDQSTLSLAQGHHAVALDHAQAARQVGEDLDDRVLQCWADHRTALAHLGLGDVGEARQCCRRCAAVVRLLGDQRLSILTLETFAVLAIAENHKSKAVSLNEAAQRHRDRWGIPRTPPEQRLFGPMIERAAADLDPAAADVARNVGRRWTLERGLTEAESD
jgi:predicted ATPase/glycosyltransferase involved in cell wall biosynthesis